MIRDGIWISHPGEIYFCLYINKFDWIRHPAWFLCWVYFFFDEPSPPLSLSHNDDDDSFGSDSTLDSTSEHISTALEMISCKCAMWCALWWSGGVSTKCIWAEWLDPTGLFSNIVLPRTALLDGTGFGCWVLLCDWRCWCCCSRHRRINDTMASFRCCAANSCGGGRSCGGLWSDEVFLDTIFPSIHLYLPFLMVFQFRVGGFCMECIRVFIIIKCVVEHRFDLAFSADDKLTWR